MALINKLIIRNCRLQQLSKPIFVPCQSSFDFTKLLSTHSNFNRNQKYGNLFENGDEAADKSKWKSFLVLTFGTAAALYVINKQTKVVEMKERDKSNKILKSSPEKYVDGLPEYSYEDIAKHTTEKTGIWVTYKYGVYDITKFINKHPGGKQILEAVGGPVDPFWDLYQQHNNAEVTNMLESYRIGNYKDAHEGNDISNIWSNQPKRDPRLIVRSEKPFNAETPNELLGKSFITESNLFYVRHHLPVPEIDIEKFQLKISSSIDSSKTLTLSLDDIKKFPKYSVTAALMCAGNRRANMNKHKQTKGLEWASGAVGNAVWSGARLKDVLEAAGIKPDESLHVQFSGMDLDATGKPYGASIPLSIALDERKDVILAYEMNNHPIPRDHGFPLRAFIPGAVGARCVKWLNEINISKEESLSHWQRQDYKGFNPSVDPTTDDWAQSTSIQYLPVISAILSPASNENVTPVNGYVEVKGYAWSGAGQKIIRIDLTGDQGKTWIDGKIVEQDKMPAGRHYAWTLWSAKIPVQKGQKEIEIWVKAVDSNYNTQPESAKNIWNVRGVLNNSMDSIRIKIKQ